LKRRNPQFCEAAAGTLPLPLLPLLLLLLLLLLISIARSDAARSIADQLRSRGFEFPAGVPTQK